MNNYKKQLKTKNFKLMDVFRNIKLGWKPSEIAYILETTIQDIQYYINKLKRQGYIQKVGYGTWEVKKELKDFSIGTPTTNIHALNIKIPIISGTIQDNDWEVKEKLNNWLPKYKDLNILGGLKFKNCNNKSIVIYVKSRDIKTLDLNEIDNLAFKVRAFVGDYFKKEGVILDILNAKTKNINLATQNNDLKGTLRSGEVFKLDLGKKAEKIFPNDDMDAWAMMDNSPNPNSVETNDKDWKREYLNMPFRIKDMFGLIHSQLELLHIQTKSTTALAQNIESHIPSWMSNVKVEQELRKLRQQMSIKQKKMSDWL